jgi:hypothetical protein
MDFSLVICAVQSAINEHPTSWIHRRHAQGLFSTSKTVQRRRLTDEHEQRDVRHTPSPIKIGWCDVVRLLWTNLAPSVLLRHALAYETQRRQNIVVPNRMVGGLPSMGWAIGPITAAAAMVVRWWLFCPFSRGCVTICDRVNEGLIDLQSQNRMSFWAMSPIKTTLWCPKNQITVF